MPTRKGTGPVRSIIRRCCLGHFSVTAQPISKDSLSHLVKNHVNGVYFV